MIDDYREMFWCIFNFMTFFVVQNNYNYSITHITNHVHACMIYLFFFQNDHRAIAFPSISLGSIAPTLLFATRNSKSRAWPAIYIYILAPRWSCPNATPRREWHLARSTRHNAMSSIVIGASSRKWSHFNDLVPRAEEWSVSFTNRRR